MNPQVLSVLSFTFCLNIAESKKKRKIKSSNPSSQPQQILEYFFIGFFILALTGVLTYLINKRSQLMRAEKLRSIKRALEVKEKLRKEKPCTMTQMQKEETVAWFAKNNWILEESQSKQQPKKNSLKIVSVKRKQQPIDGLKELKDYYDAYYFEMKGISVMIFGVIMFQKYFPTILFEKSVSNSKNDLGNYNYKFFDGVLKKGQFEGKWYTSDDTKIQQEREAWKEKELNKSKNGEDEPLSERSFSHDRSSDDLLSLNRPKVQRGTFKLYHD